MEHRFYLGIDLDDQYAVISSYELNKKEPETFSAIAGSEIYQIPALITKKKGIGQWFVGEEAVRLAIAQGEDCLLYTSPSPRDRQKSRMPSSA